MVMDEVAIAKLKGTCITAARHYTELTNKECCFRQSRLHKPTIQICARDKHLRFANPKRQHCLERRRVLEAPGLLEAPITSSLRELLRGSNISESYNLQGVGYLRYYLVRRLLDWGEFQGMEG